MPATVPPAAPWMSYLLKAAGMYNLTWGIVTVLSPSVTLRLSGLPITAEVQPIWQGLGLLIGIFGIGYWISARDPYRHWLIILIGLLGKVLGPFGYVVSVWRGVLPIDGAWTLLTNDLIWWIPFTLILSRAAAWHDAQTLVPLSLAGDPLRHVISNTRQNLFELSSTSRLLVVFLRHSGCTFCREALADLAEKRAQIESSGARIALVHMSPDADIVPIVEKYKVADLPRFQDTQRQLYRTFDLQSGSLFQILGLNVLLRGFRVALIEGHGFGGAKDSIFQMPGAFLVENGKITRAFRHQSPADRPDYADLACPIKS